MKSIFIIASMIMSLCLSQTVWAFPNEQDYRAIMLDGVPLADIANDAAPPVRDLYGTNNDPTAFLALADGRVWIRLRVDDIPADPVTGQILPWSWALLIDSDLDDNDFEFSITADGITQSFQILENTTLQYENLMFDHSQDFENRPKIDAETSSKSPFLGRPLAISKK